jgi:prepilin-type N-terminal cleavage/methylation domain-containing protein/prepilin-type processing-associated H-X9-DG protein
MLPCKHSTHPRSGFTLVELLAVIGIIGILAAILIPVVSSVRASAKSSQCQSNLRQLGIAMRLYAQDHKRKFPVFADEPRAPQTPTNLHLYGKIAPYLDLNYTGSFGPNNIRDTALVCPSSPIPENANYTTIGSTTYGVNTAISPYWGFTAWNYALDIPNPSRTFLMIEMNGGWGAQFSIASHGAPGNARNRIVHSGGSSNYLFVDGHVENIQGHYPDASDPRWYRQNL